MLAAGPDIRLGGRCCRDAQSQGPRGLRGGGAAGDSREVRRAGKGMQQIFPLSFFVFQSDAARPWRRAGLASRWPGALPACNAACCGPEGAGRNNFVWLTHARTARAESHGAKTTRQGRNMPRRSSAGDAGKRLRQAAPQKASPGQYSSGENAQSPSCALALHLQPTHRSALSSMAGLLRRSVAPAGKSDAESTLARWSHTNLPANQARLNVALCSALGA